MYEGKNPTALTSRGWLVDALLTLMKTMPYSKITVKDICRQADLSRQTFYNFFDTKDDIIRFRIDQCYVEMMDRLKNTAPLHLTDITEQLMATFQNNREFMSLIVAQQLDHLLEFALACNIRSFTEKVNPDGNRHICEYGNAFLAGAIAHTILYWFKDDSPLAASQVSDLLSSILAGNYYQIEI